MRIESIKIRNVRQLKELLLRFGVGENDNDLHIILAENGVGKTNIVNAITWCLYNKEMHLRDEETALPLLNNQLIEELRMMGGGSAEALVELTISTDNSKDKITFKRIGNFRVTDDACILLSDKLSVTMMDGGGFRIIDDEEETTRLIHKYLPEEINNYIFFDGEQLEKFFSQNQLDNVRSGINELTQASYLEKSYEFLDSYIRSMLNPKIANLGSKEIAEQQKKVNALFDQIELSINTIEEFKRQIKVCDDEISKLTIAIRGCENLREKTEELEKVEIEMENLRDREARKTKELMKFTREFFTYFGLYPSLKTFFNYIKEQDTKGNLPPRIDKKILSKILSSRHCSICDSENLNDHCLEHVKELENSLAVASATSAELNRSFGSLNTIITKIQEYKSQKEKMVLEINGIRKDFDERDERYQQLQRYLRAIPDNEEITESLDKKDVYDDQKVELIGNKAVEESNKKCLEDLYQIENKKLQVLISKQKELEEIERQKEFCESCSKIMKECKEEILDECRKMIQKRTFEIFDRLIWKKDAFSKVEILDNYAFKLLDAYGTQALGSCSAAETALLALSFTLALQEVSKHDSLLFIDTPIGRVGEENRTNFMDTLLEISKNKQVILTFTPTEYDANVQRILSNKYNTFYTLIMNNNVTNIR
jgi:DNA sulfur modification protein DndD